MTPSPEQPTVSLNAEATEPKSFDTIYWWIALVLLLGALFLTWMNHFGNGFHQDDTHAIVENPAVRSGSAGRVLISARAASTLKEYSAWRPLATITWLFDYRILGANPAIFYVDSFLWFLWVLVWSYTLARLIPGSSAYSALLAVSLIAFHPLTADLLNYVSHRYLILRALSLTLTLVLFDAWPRRVPASIWFEVRRIPRSEWDVRVRRMRTSASKAWKLLVALPVPWYFIPLILGLLSDPGTAIFPLILIVWIKLFDSRRNLRDVFPSAVLCGIWWLAHTLFTIGPTAALRQPALQWWWTQPWVALRCFADFFVPFGLSPDSDLQVFQSPFSIEPIAGIAGIGVLIGLAMLAARYIEFRVVSFGLAWFLIALLPDFLLPGQNVEELSRAFVPMIGLSIAAAGLFWLAVVRIGGDEPWRQVAAGAMGLAAVAAMVLLALGANARNPFWTTEADLWNAVLESSPSNPRALLNHGREQIMNGDTDGGYANLQKAHARQPKSAEIELSLAMFAESAGKQDAEEHFKRALALAPSSPTILAAWSDWLLLKNRNKEAENLARQAVHLDAYSAPARRAVMNVDLANRQWQQAADFGLRTLDLLPADSDALRTVNVAKNALDEIARAETRAKTNPTVENYLKLSIEKMQGGHFEDGIEACRAALKIQPDLAEAWSNISVGYHMMGKTDESIAALREAIRLRPDLPNLKQNLEAELATKAALAAPATAPETKP